MYIFTVSFLDLMRNMPNTTIHLTEAHILSSRMMQIKFFKGQFSASDSKMLSQWVFYTLGALRQDVFLKRRVLMMRSADMGTTAIRIGIKSMLALNRLAELLLNTVILTYQDSELIVCFPEISDERFVPQQ